VGLAAARALVGSSDGSDDLLGRDVDVRMAVEHVNPSFCGENDLAAVRIAHAPHATIVPTAVRVVDSLFEPRLRWLEECETGAAWSMSAPWRQSRPWTIRLDAYSRRKSLSGRGLERELTVLRIF